MYSPGPTATSRPHDPTMQTHICTRTHAHAQGHGPAPGPWWQRWTHTQLWELQKLARAEPSLDGLVRRLRRGLTENRRRRPAGRWMPQCAWEGMLAVALHPRGVQPHQLFASQDNLHVLRRLRKALKATPKEGRRLCDIIPSPPLRTGTSSPPRKRRGTDPSGDTTIPTHSIPGAPRALQRPSPGRRRPHLTPRRVLTGPLAQLALHNPHISANSLKPVCFLCFLLFWCPLLPFIETGTLKIYTKMVLYMQNEFLTSNTPHGV